MTSTLLTAKQFTKMNKIELLSFIIVRWGQGKWIEERQDHNEVFELL